jgi:C_GCAxxG_C_C family probable redox protein
LAVAETVNLKVFPAAPKMASGFHGGGGRIGVGEDSAPTGCLCGALAGAVLALSVIYGRTSPKGTRYGCIAYASGYLHQRFFAEVGGKCCSMLRPLYQRLDAEKSCQELYRKGAELGVEALFAAPATFNECTLPQSLRRLIKAPPSAKKTAGKLKKRPA